MARCACESTACVTRHDLGRCPNEAMDPPERVCEGCYERAFGADLRNPQHPRPVRVDVALNRMGYWAADAYRDGKCVATYGAAVTVAEALRQIADNPELEEERPMIDVRDGPNADGYDNSINPLVLYALCTTVVPARPTGPQPIVNEVYLGSDPLALARFGGELKTSFAANHAGELHFQVVQCRS